METPYADELKIDPDSLDVEWLDQPRRFMHYAELLAQARRAMDEAKEQLDLIRAETARQVRDNPSSFGLEKITEGAVNDAVLMTADYKNALNILNSKKFDVDVLTAAVRAFDQRKDALENLVRLHGQQYFAGPSVPRDLGAEWAKRVERGGTRAEVKSRLNRSR